MFFMYQLISQISLKTGWIDSTIAQKQELGHLSFYGLSILWNCKNNIILTRLIRAFKFLRVIYIVAHWTQLWSFFCARISRSLWLVDATDRSRRLMISLAGLADGTLVDYMMFGCNMLKKISMVYISTLCYSLAVITLDDKLPNKNVVCTH
jgi:hypothetical protein